MLSMVSLGDTVHQTIRVPDTPRYLENGAVIFSPLINKSGLLLYEEQTALLPKIRALLPVRVRHFAVFTHGDKPVVAVGDAVDVRR